MKKKAATYFVKLIKLLGVGRFILNTPLTFIGTKDWLDKNKSVFSCEFIPLEQPVHIRESPPIVIGHSVSRRFSRYFDRTSVEAFVAMIPKAMVFGEFSNFVITPDNEVLADVSREFGAYGGRKPERFSLLSNRMRMPGKEKLKGNIAVVSTCGSNNFHHWNFDVLPRLELLDRAGVLKRIDKFIIHHEGLKFQLEGLSKFNITPDKIINPRGNQNYFIEAESLYIPSLPQELGNVSPWIIDFLRDIFLKEENNLKTGNKLFISRRNAPSRKIINHQEVLKEILSHGFIEFIPENFSMEEVARYFSGARSIVSVHGSGLSNLPFVEEGAKVLDIMAPYHQDPYYWMICNQRKAKYVALFAEGEHPGDDLDLVRHHVDADLMIDLSKLRVALGQIS